MSLMEEAFLSLSFSEGLAHWLPILREPYIFREKLAVDLGGRPELQRVPEDIDLLTMVLRFIETYFRLA